MPHELLEIVLDDVKLDEAQPETLAMSETDVIGCVTSTITL